MDFWKLKAHPSEHMLSNKAIPPNDSQTSSTNYQPVIQIYKYLEAILIQTTTNSLVEVDHCNYNLCPEVELWICL